MAGNPLITMGVKPADVVGSYVGGLMNRSLYDQQQGEAKKAKAEDMTRALGFVANAATGVQDEAGLANLKGLASRLFPDQADNIAQMTLADVPQLQAGLTSLFDQLKMRIAGEKGAAEVGYINAGTEYRKAQTTDIGTDNARADWKTGSDIANDRARTGAYVANAQDQIVKRADGAAKDAATAYGQAPEGTIFDPATGTARQITLPDGSPVVPPKAAGGVSPKDFPASVIKAEDEDASQLRTALELTADTEAWSKRVKGMAQSGDPNLGLAQNMGSRILNYVGLGTPESADYAELKAFATRLVNESLRLNKGVQTEGDAQRAASELLSNLNDPTVVARQMDVLNALNRRREKQLRFSLEDRRKRLNLPAMDLSGYQTPDSPYSRAGVGQPSSPVEDANALLKKYGIE